MTDDHITPKHVHQETPIDRGGINGVNHYRRWNHVGILKKIHQQLMSSSESSEKSNHHQLSATRFTFNNINILDRSRAQSNIITIDRWSQSVSTIWASIYRVSSRDSLNGVRSTFEHVASFYKIPTSSIEHYRSQKNRSSLIYAITAVLF